MDAPKFTAELKAKWIEALRSGDYSQCRMALRADDGYCCLGVLAEVSGFQSLSDQVLSIEKVDGFDFTDSAVLLSQEWQRELAKRNDSGDDFQAIAAYIEANIPAAAAQPTND